MASKKKPPTTPDKPAPVQASPDRYDHLKTTNARKALERSVYLLKQHDYEQWDISGIGGVIALLNNALGKMPAKGARSKKIAVGVQVRVREKFREEYASLGFGSGAALKVLAVSVNGKTASCRTPPSVDYPEGQCFVMPLRHIERAPSPEKPTAFIVHSEVAIDASEEPEKME